MLYYDRTDISEGIDVAKSNNSKEYIICYYRFFNHGLGFQNFVLYLKIVGIYKNCISKKSILRPSIQLLS